MILNLSGKTSIEETMKVQESISDRSEKGKYFKYKSQGERIRNSRVL